MSIVVAASQAKESLTGPINRLSRTVLTKRLDALRHGELTLVDSNGATSFGEDASLRATLHVHNPRFFRRAVAGGSLSVAESYIQGDWDCEDLTGLFRIFARNRDAASRFDAGLARLARTAHRLFHWRRANTRDGSRRNIGAHYDLGNEFFRLWLDDTMAYSSGIFPATHASLKEASTEKFDRVCRRLQLRSSDEVLEIGAGWGGFAIHAAGKYGCHVTATTISREQFHVIEKRIAERNLGSQITPLEKDYRDLRGQFDKLVSIEMIEAVGYRYLDQYFRQCGALLRPDGSFALQAIVMPEQGYSQYLRNVDFIQRYVFPGGCLPSLGAIMESVGRATDLQLVHAEDFAPHYAETLRRWRRRFEARLDDVRGLGYSEEFIRLWNYYLCYCEAAFEERQVGVMQIQFDKPNRRRDFGATASPTARRREARFEHVSNTSPHCSTRG